MERDELEEIKRALQSVLYEALKKLEGAASREFASSVSIEWNRRMRSTAGRAFWPERRVELNPKLLNISLAEVERTLLHELAHLLAYYRNGTRRIAPHGREWQQACCDLGIAGEKATHKLPLPSRQQTKKWRYTCPHCSEAIERVRPMKRFVACYTCCQKYNKGRYTKRFQLVKTPLL